MEQEDKVSNTVVSKKISLYFFFTDNLVELVELVKLVELGPPNAQCPMPNAYCLHKLLRINNRSCQFFPIIFCCFQVFIVWGKLHK